jgi:tetratricopeptide (TPR) repeat protein
LAQGDVRAYDQIGGIYWSGGEGMEKDIPKAIEYLEKGYEAGNVQCASTLGSLCYGGYGSPRNVELAVEWLHISADEHDDLISLRHLADYYGANPDAKKNDPEKAVHYAERLLAKNPTYETYYGAAAAAYARAGDFGKAVEIQEKCVELSKERFGGTRFTIHIERAEERLELYRKNIPYPAPVEPSTTEEREP